MIIAITVTGKDRPGIIATLTGCIVRVGGNLEDASMTILEGEFAMIFLASLKVSRALRRLEQEFRRLSKKLGLSIVTRIIKRKLARGEKHRQGTKPWVASVFGRDRAGIVHAVSKAFADEGVNITDLNSRILGRGKSASYALMIEADVPTGRRAAVQMARKLRVLEKRLKVKISLHPVESAYL